ncbi:MAG TPA: hypothetical protein VIF57_16735 [Polyangia bacterium]
MGFYYQFRARLVEAVQAEKTTNGDGLGADPVFWKAAGDELLFTKALTEPKQAWRTIRTFRRAVLSYREELQKKQPSLDVKAHAWIAGFPILNARIPMDDDGARDLDIEGEPPVVAYRLEHRLSKKEALSTSIDYLGPSIDLGFRLGKLAERRKFIVSADLAYLLCDQEDKDDKEIRFWYEGRQQLKGILGDRPYPLFWIDMNSGGIDVQEDGLLGRQPIDRHKVRDFCRLFLDDTAGAMCLPYIVSDEGKAVYSVIPSAHQQALTDLRRLAAAETERDSIPLNTTEEASASKAVPKITTALSTFLSRVEATAPTKSMKKKPPNVPSRTSRTGKPRRSGKK